MFIFYAALSFFKRFMGFILDTLSLAAWAIAGASFLIPYIPSHVASTGATNGVLSNPIHHPIAHPKPYTRADFSIPLIAHCIHHSSWYFFHPAYADHIPSAPGRTMFHNTSLAQYARGASAPIKDAHCSSRWFQFHTLLSQYCTAFAVCHIAELITPFHIHPVSDSVHSKAADHRSPFLKLFGIFLLYNELINIF